MASNMQASLDHDILITLVETVKNNHATVLNRIETVRQDVNEIKDGVNLKLADHELRIRSIEQLRDKLNPDEVLTMVRRNDAQIRAITMIYKVTVTILIIETSIITFVLTNAYNVAKLFHR